jgi:hypothetical protein
MSRVKSRNRKLRLLLGPQWREIAISKSYWHWMEVAKDRRDEKKLKPKGVE